MAVQRDRPYPTSNFVVDLGNGGETPAEGVAEVVFPDARVYTYEYRNGNEPENQPRSVQATTHYGNLILKRGAIGSLNWYNWWDKVRNGDITDLRTVSVMLYDESHQTVVMGWKFLRARPVAYGFSTLNALTGDILIERMELAFERMEMG